MNDTQSPKPKTVKKSSKKAVVKNDHVDKTPVNVGNYYQLDRILKENADYNIIIGERGNGKTYAVQKFLIEDYLKNGRQCFLLRRWDDDVKQSNAQNFWDGNLINQLPELTNGLFTTIVLRANRYFLTYLDDKGKPVLDESNIIGHVNDVHNAEQMKGQSYPNVGNIVYEEFISLTTNGYLPDELSLFLNVLSTIIRDRTDVKIWMLGNTVNPYNPYFKHFGIDGFALNQGEITTKYDIDTGCKIAIEFCAKRRTGSLYGTSAKYFAFGNNDGSTDMILSGKWQLPNYPTRKFVKINSRWEFYIRFDDHLMDCHIMIEKGDYYLFVRELSNKTNIGRSNIVLDLIPNTNPNYYTSLANVPIGRLPEILFTIVNNNKIWFDNRMTGAYYYNFMAQAFNNRTRLYR